ncbi:sulfotransferase domain-containing protein [Sulfitobacter sp. M220]|uniref:sulfotransferase domain-containing protein n=1 Tax=Sulfitobacter sp. M220 TaxID=2675333 RepID=UPI001F1BC1A2|nr:sulfotransferase domain-containing protein [Sulfitobacter sp. M220]
MSYPDFIIIGACKSGTTTLYDDLCGHPHVYMPEIKEPDILHRSSTAGSAHMLYAKHFASAPNGALCGEGSTYYTMQPDFASVAEHALDVCGPTLKLIYIVRDPIDRILSHIAHDMSVGRVPIAPGDELLRNHPRYRAWSDYPMQLSSWVETFGKENILLLYFDDLVSNRTTTVERTAKFLGLDPSLLPERTAISNIRGSQPGFTSGILQKFAQSTLYQFSIRRFLPSGLRDRLKSIFMHRNEIPSVELSSTVKSELEAYFANYRSTLADLLNGTSTNTNK